RDSKITLAARRMTAQVGWRTRFATMCFLQILLSPLLTGAVCSATLLCVVSAPLLPLTAEYETEAETDPAAAVTTDWSSHSIRARLPQPCRGCISLQRITSARLSIPAASAASDGHRLPNGLNAPLTC
ncbi:MAG: hypothetical protein KDA96_22500, partial [Planctomycetaceae bacterium]|nr:hypothetical protein [Planctomycetaceae bacterium]